MGALFLTLFSSSMVVVADSAETSALNAVEGQMFAHSASSRLIFVHIGPGKIKGAVLYLTHILVRITNLKALGQRKMREGERGLKFDIFDDKKATR